MPRISPRFLIFLLVAFLPTLACQAAARVIQPATPLPAAGARDAAPSPPPTQPSETVFCPAEMESVIDAAMGGSKADSQIFSRDDHSITLVKYKVDGDTHGEPLMQSIPLELRAYQQDLAAHERVWSLFTSLIPADERALVREFRIFTDGRNNLLAAVQQTANDPGHWILEVDIADTSNAKNLAFSLIHEVGHLLTLDPSQVPPDLELFKHPNDEDLYDKKAAACPNYFPGEGCSLEASYINAFFGRFWGGLNDEWAAIDAIQSDRVYSRKLDAFYEKYQDQFVDDYAVTSASEDIAESWTFFVLSPKPAGDTIAEQKLLFFHAYPALVQARAGILKGLCTAGP